MSKKNPLDVISGLSKNNWASRSWITEEGGVGKSKKRYCIMGWLIYKAGFDVNNIVYDSNNISVITILEDIYGLTPEEVDTLIDINDDVDVPLEERLKNAKKKLREIVNENGRWHETEAKEPVGSH